MQSPWRTAQSGEAHYLSPGAGVSRGLHAQVGYRDIYPGIDVRYRGTDGHVEQDFLVAAGASPDRIRFRVDDARATLTATGAIDIAVGAAVHMRLEAPQAWQVNADGSDCAACPSPSGSQTMAASDSRSVPTTPPASSSSTRC